MVVSGVMAPGISRRGWSRTGRWDRARGRGRSNTNAAGSSARTARTQLADTRVGLNIGGHLIRGHGLSITLALRPARENSFVIARQFAGTGQLIGNARTAERRGAGRCVLSVHGKSGAWRILGVHRRLDIGENVALNKYISPLTDVKGVTAVVLPKVVVCVPMAIELDLRRTARRVVDVVVSKSDLIALAIAEPVGN